MEFGELYDIVEYGNKNWKCNFTPKEIAVNAFDLLIEFETSQENEEPTHAIKELAKLLAEDGSDQCKVWLYKIATILNLIDMDFADYLETDEWLKDFLEIK